MMTLTTHSVVFIVVSDSNQSVSRDRQSHSDVIDEIDILHSCYSVHPRDMCSVLAFCSCQVNNVPCKPAKQATKSAAGDAEDVANPRPPASLPGNSLLC